MSIDAAPEQIVRDFLTAIERGDMAAAAALLAPDAQWVNVSLPTIRGGERIAAMLDRLQRANVGFRVAFHSVTVDGNTVITERDDALTWRRIEQRFWVWGRFEVRDGQITLWRDSFDWLDLSGGLIRGLLGAIHPRLNRPWPRHH